MQQANQKSVKRSQGKTSKKKANSRTAKALIQWLSKCGLWIKSISITWIFARNINSQVPTQKYRVWGLALAICVLISSSGDSGLGMTTLGYIKNIINNEIRYSGGSHPIDEGVLFCSWYYLWKFSRALRGHLGQEEERKRGILVSNTMFFFTHSRSVEMNGIDGKLRHMGNWGKQWKTWYSN